MAGIAVGGGGARRATNHDIPLIPFIDFLLCLVMFLLVTAVWSHLARMDADARVPGQGEGVAAQPPALELHVRLAGERNFQLQWRKGSTVLDSTDVPRQVRETDGEISYPGLAEAIERAWKGRTDTHRSSKRLERDRAVLHTDNSIEFEHLAAVMDAIHATRRSLRTASGAEEIAAFQVAFATD